MPPRMQGAPSPPKAGAVGYVPTPGSGARAGAYLAKVAASSPTEGRAAFKYDFGNEDANNQDLRNDSTIAHHRTAARTGTTFDMADLLTHGHATKFPGEKLPESHPAVQVIRLNEKNLPGDMLGQSPRHPANSLPIEERISMILRERSLSIVDLMDDFLKRPQYSRMPVRNRSFLDVPTFRRAICYAMGDQWTRLAMTSAEFDALVKKHMRLDAAHGSQVTDVQGFGQPEPLILWMPFAYAVQKMADGGKYDIQLRGKLSAEQQALYDKNHADINAFEAQTRSESKFDVGGFIQSSNTTAALEGMRAKQMVKQREEDKPTGKRGARVGEVNFAKRLICERLMKKHSTVRAALKDIDDSGDGVLSREEIKKMLQDFNLMKYFDFYTGLQRGDLDVKVVETLLDEVDSNGDGIINYDEFSASIMKAAN